jgi:hypothetical protein
MKPTLLCLCLLTILAASTTCDALATVFVVDDNGDPLPTLGTMTLRQAILNANAAGPGPHQIIFQIPMTMFPIIQPVSELPAIAVGQVTIDGFTQPGASPGLNPPATTTLLVEIDGSLAGPAHGLILTSSFNTIQGLVVRNFMRDGIRIQGTPAGSNSNTVWANFVGTDVTGTLPAGNAWGTGNIWAGVDILCTPSEFVCFCTANVVQGNLISGNHRCGVQISSCPPSDCWANHVLTNYIGTDITGMFALGNAGTGLVLAEGTHDNSIGHNVISANGANGVDLTGNYYTTPPCDTRNNHFLSNLIGLGSDGVQPLGNNGRGASCGIFEINSFYGGFCNANDFIGNTVACNGMAGFSVWEHPLSTSNADQETFWKNVTYFNLGLGIDLGDDGPTPNDPGDPDTGANQLINYPIILTAVHSAGNTTVTGVGDPAAEVNLYRAALQIGDVEGNLWLGSVWPNPLGNWTLAVTGLNVGNSVTATAMDWAGGGVYSNTSEFAAPLLVQQLSGVAESIGAPGFRLALAGPNPFGSATAFRYEIPETGRVTLRIYGARGELVRTLVDEIAGAGPHGVRWDGAAADGGGSAAGVYFAVLNAGGQKARLRVVRVE